MKKLIRMCTLYCACIVLDKVRGTETLDIAAIFERWITTGKRA